MKIRECLKKHFQERLDQAVYCVVDDKEYFGAIKFPFFQEFMKQATTHGLPKVPAPANVTAYRAGPYLEKGLIADVERFSQFLGDFLPDRAFAVFHFGNVSLGNARQCREFPLGEPFFSSGACQNNSGQLVVAIRETLTPRNRVGNIDKAQSVESRDSLSALSGRTKETQLHFSCSNTGRFRESLHT